MTSCYSQKLSPSPNPLASSEQLAVELNYSTWVDKSVASLSSCPPPPGRRQEKPRSPCLSALQRAPGRAAGWPQGPPGLRPIVLRGTKGLAPIRERGAVGADTELATKRQRLTHPPGSFFSANSFVLNIQHLQRVMSNMRFVF